MLARLNLAVQSALAAPGMTVPFYPVMRGRAAVLMLHRFRDPRRGTEGDDPGILRRALDMLRRRRYELIPLDDLFRRLRGEGKPVSRAVAFTIDDGYAEQAEIAGPVFAEFDCPVTTFVTTGFLDGQLWFWWDRIAWILRQTRRTRLEVAMPETTTVLAWNSEAERLEAAAQFTSRCKSLPDDEKRAAISRLADGAEVALPASPPPEFAPMSWEQLRRAEGSGMSFGPHTVTHPILSRTSDEESRREIADSWTRLREEARSPVPVFCYPNGTPADFGSREIATICGCGMSAAVVGVGPRASVEARFLRDDDREGPYRIQRLPYPGNLVRLVQYVSGLEVVKRRLKGVR